MLSAPILAVRFHSACLGLLGHTPLPQAAASGHGGSSKKCFAGRDWPPLFSNPSGSKTLIVLSPPPTSEVLSQQFLQKKLK